MPRDKLPSDPVIASEAFGTGRRGSRTGPVHVDVLTDLNMCSGKHSAAARHVCWGAAYLEEFKMDELGVGTLNIEANISKTRR